MTDPATDASGHRARLRKRLIEQGPEALLDHELVEYLLALAIPRRDTKPLARALLAEHGGLGALLAADGETLARSGLGEGAVAALKIAEAAALRLLRSKVSDRPVLASWQALIDYLQADMAHRLIERVRVLHLNSRNILIRDELVAEGSIDQAAVYGCERQGLESQHRALPAGDFGGRGYDLQVLDPDAVRAVRVVAWFV